jgi:hypothetical protein
MLNPTQIMKKIIAIVVPILAVLLSACGSEMPVISSTPPCPGTRNFVRAFIAPRSIEVESIDMKRGHILLRLPEDTARSVFPGASVSEEKNKLYKALSEEIENPLDWVDNDISFCHTHLALGIRSFKVERTTMNGTTEDISSQTDIQFLSFQRVLKSHFKMEPERVQKRLATLTAEDMKWLPAGDEASIHLYVPKTQAKSLTISIGFADGTVLQKTIDRFQ